LPFIGAGLQARLLQAAKKEFGEYGEGLLGGAARQTFDVPLEQVTYGQLTALFAAVDRVARTEIGAAMARDAAAAIRQARADVEASLSDLLIGLVARRMGPAAEPFLDLLCSRLGLTLASIDRAHLPELAEAVLQTAASLLGDEAARGLATAVLEAGIALSSGLTETITGAVAEHLGPDADGLLRGLCRGRLEVDLVEIDLDTIEMLISVIERDGPSVIGAMRAEAFVTAGRQAVTSPSEPLRRKISELVTNTIGPAGSDFARQVSAQHGVPFNAIEHEHVMWLAEVLRGETAPLAGKKYADRLAHEVRGLLTGLK
jgi:hypothetical protein